MFHMTSEEIQAQLTYCEILFRSGVYSDFASPEEMFAVIEAGKLSGQPALESLMSLRFSGGRVVAKEQAEPALDVPAPKTVAQTGVVAAVVETIKQAVVAKQEQAAAPSVAPAASAPSTELDAEAQEAVEMYVSWLEQAKDMNTLDRILYRLKFEEDRENVKAAVRPVFKEVMKKLERKEAEERGAVQQSTATFRAEPVDQANGHKNLAGLSQRAEGRERENQENAQHKSNQRQGDQDAAVTAIRPLVDNSLAHSPTDLSVKLGDIIAAHVQQNRYDITPSEKKHMVAKIVACNSTEELFAAAGSIQKYYIKNTSTDIMPLLDRLCTERLREIVGMQSEEEA